ncbi:hypothetical protein SUDANB121_01079 [Nocardiopsis dassonvillei]|uniref:type I-E CRISPR-associated protein Cse2/CasB n=1 Tax=Nocardiopsis dassonvillei TaxID=2014 RepID=UPI003F55E9C4
MSAESVIFAAAERMVENLGERVRDEPAVRAVLRRAVGKRVEDPGVLPVHTFVARYLNGPLAYLEGVSDSRWRPPEQDVERAFYGVAAMIAAQPRQARERKASEEDGGTGEDTARAQVPESAPGAEPDGSEVPQETAQKGPDPLCRRANLGALLGRAVTEGRLNADTTEARLHLLCRQSADSVHSHLPRLVLYARDKDVDIHWSRLVLDLSRWGGDRDTVAKEWVQSYHRVIETERARRENASQNQNPATDDTDEDHAA